MKTIYLKRKRSGNYEISTRKDFTVKFNKISELNGWFNSVLSKEKTNVWDKRNRVFKISQVIKVTYSRSNTFFNSTNDLINFNEKNRS